MGIPTGATTRVHPWTSVLATQPEQGHASLCVFRRQQQNRLDTISVVMESFVVLVITNSLNPQKRSHSN